MSRAEPRFDISLKYGLAHELQVQGILEAAANGKIEVKAKRYLDLEFYIEEYCDKGRTGNYEPSGINVTESDTWALCVADSGIVVFVPTDLLRRSLSHPTVRQKEETDGQCPTRGRLVNLLAILDTHRRSTSATPAPSRPQDASSGNRTGVAHGEREHQDDHPALAETDEISAWQAKTIRDSKAWAKSAEREATKAGVRL